MDKTKKLKVVFDFIADYLSDEEKEVVIETTKEELTITENNSDEQIETPSHLKRAYTIMKKIDERDASKAITSHAVNEATRPLKKQIEETKRRFDEVQEGQLLKRDLSDPLSDPLSELGGFKEHTTIRADMRGKVTQEEAMKAKSDAIELKNKLTETKIKN